MFARDSATQCSAPYSNRLAAAFVGASFTLFAFLATSAATGGSRFLLFTTTPRLEVDIDIGTAGEPMASNRMLVSFDPFDAPLTRPSHERYPYLISDHDGLAPFFVNRILPKCSSEHQQNTKYNRSTLDRLSSGGACFGRETLSRCMDSSQIERKEVPSIRLSTFVRQRGIAAIGLLKIDAQGSDFSILKDLFENTAVMPRKIVFECQQYRQGVPLYFTNNDCEEIKFYLRQKLPASAAFTEKANNCVAREYNVFVDVHPENV